MLCGIIAGVFQRNFSLHSGVTYK